MARKKIYDDIILNFLENKEKIRILVEIEAHCTTIYLVLKRRITFINLKSVSVGIKNNECYLLSINEWEREKDYEKFKDFTSNIQYLDNAELSENELGDKIQFYVNKICIDFTEQDKKHLINEIKKTKIRLLFYGFTHETLIVAHIFLLAKCPANSDKPLNIREIYRRLRKINPDINISILNSAVYRLRDVGVENCKITPENTINSFKDKLIEFYNKLGLDGLEIINKAIEKSRDPIIKRKTIGRNPYVLGASLIRIVQPKNGIYQREIAEIFGVSILSTSNTCTVLAEKPVS